MDEKKKAFERLLTIMDELREKCPWDKKQTFESLRHLTIEETYELSDAILAKNVSEIKKELGDLMLHIVFYAKIASESAHFDIADVLNGICDKLIARHPHIYGNVTVSSEEEVSKNWEKLKVKEHGNQKRVLSGVPSSLPSLIKAMRIQEKVRGVGFDWEEKSQVWDKVKEELDEFERILNAQSPIDPLKAEEEFGDLLFSLVNYARFIGINPETALEKTNKKFIQRFTFLEEQAQKDGKQLIDMTLAEMDVYWNMAKKQERRD